MQHCRNQQKITMNTPSIYFSNTVAQHLQQVQTEIAGDWVPKRPESMGGLMLMYRLHCAWHVFTGRYDVLRWPDQE